MRAEHLYVHVPFCGRRCVYCDFSIAVRSRVPAEEYLRSVDNEWTARHARSVFELETLYFGGGTPSKLGGSGIRRLMDLVHRHATVRPGAEITLEANPEDVDATSVGAWMAAGINRVSLGVQSFDDRVLAWMHRTHDAKEARRAIQVLHEAGLANVSIDLIFALPRKLGRRWDEDLLIALDSGVPHVSIYGLTVEPHTPLGRWVARAEEIEAPEESFETEYLAAHDRLTAAGFDHYEVSNYGRPGFHSRHNWAYWTRRPYGGLGPSAHEFDGQRRRWNVEAYGEWVHRSAHDTIAGQEELDGEQVVAEEVYLGLRTTRGMRIVERGDEHIARLGDAGWARTTPDGTLRLTGPGWLRLDSIARDLTQLRSR